MAGAMIDRGAANFWYLDNVVALYPDEVGVGTLAGAQMFRPVRLIVEHSVQKPIWIPSFYIFICIYEFITKRDEVLVRDEDPVGSVDFWPAGSGSYL